MTTTLVIRRSGYDDGLDMFGDDAAAAPDYYGQPDDFDPYVEAAAHYVKPSKKAKPFINYQTNPKGRGRACLDAEGGSDWEEMETEATVTGQPCALCNKLVGDIQC